MQYKISQSDWIRIGKKTGWLKEAQMAAAAPQAAAPQAQDPKVMQAVSDLTEKIKKSSWVPGAWKLNFRDSLCTVLGQEKMPSACAKSLDGDAIKAELNAALPSVTGVHLTQLANIFKMDGTIFSSSIGNQPLPSHVVSAFQKALA